MRKAKAVRKRVGRPAGRKPVMALRVDQTLYDRLQAAADASGRTLAEETVRRLFRTLSEEFGTEMRRVGEMMTSTFWFAGQQAATQSGQINPTPRDWLQNQYCYRTALVQVATNLIEGMPEATPDEKALVIEDIKGRIATGLIRSGELKFTFKDAKGAPGEES